MIGKIYTALFPYYDRKLQRNSYKKRPILIIAGPRNNDFTVLPVSSVSIKKNLDIEYDIEIDPVKFPKLNLAKLSYIRVHKRTIIHQSVLDIEVADLRTEYEEFYLSILEKWEDFNKHIMDEALS